MPADWLKRTVPPDVWRHLFGIFHRECTGSIAALDIIRISHVCSWWRNIINDAPELWTKVDIEARLYRNFFWTGPNAECLALVLSNSRGLPLIMSLGTADRYHERSDLEPIKVFMRAINRAKTLRISTYFAHSLLVRNPRVLKEVKDALQPPLVLEKLVVKGGKSLNGAMHLLSNAWMDVPLLKSVSIQDGPCFEGSIYDAKSVRFPFHQLMILRLELHIEGLFHVLSSTPRLVTAAFFITALYGFNPRYAKFVRLDALRDLTAHAVSEDDEVEYDIDDFTQIQPIMRILEFIAAPRLTKLSLCFWGSTWRLNSFLKFVDVSSSPRIGDFHLDTMSGSQRDKIECLKRLPFLQRLHLTMNHHVSEWPEDCFIGEVFWAALQEWDREAEEFVICPYLEKVTVGYNAQHMSAWTSCATMVEERSRRGRDVELIIIDTHKLEGQGDEDSSVLELLFRLKNSGLKLTIQRSDRSGESAGE
ncbi:hypothetical protein CVT26_004384 [Gymnopilus dilepis]|uniref:Uncharacterized protein n=1 Tax=Gymnopilus dilepis TaxID=231916 RepID=A0A409WE01_9AGAR|nr:hypothetical protein CVT26_004384 [Gymnopilus dilepis]